MYKHLLISLTSFIASLIWTIIISILLLEQDILLFVMIYLLTIFPLLICAAIHTYYAGQDYNEQLSYKHFLLYFIGFTIPIFNVILCIIYIFKCQDLEAATLRSMVYLALFLILFIIAVNLSYPEIPKLYFLEVFVNPSKNRIIYLILYSINSFFYFLFYYLEELKNRKKI